MTALIATSVRRAVARIEFSSQIQWRIVDSRLIGQAMRCFNVPFISSAVVVVAVKCLTAQTAVPLVDIKSVDPNIVIELRYAGVNNVAVRALYPTGAPALVVSEVSARSSTCE